jgi:hypothetical protein
MSSSGASIVDDDIADWNIDDAGPRHAASGEPPSSSSSIPSASGASKERTNSFARHRAVSGGTVASDGGGAILNGLPSGSDDSALDSDAIARATPARTLADAVGANSSARAADAAVARVSRSFCRSERRGGVQRRQMEFKGVEGGD